ncbi:hypothetical protein Pelo_6051 [Pelomyxa schiedti]|nr:hypothetical protein Pelo_6051 [Pelomyxa schiedti]
MTDCDFSDNGSASSKPTIVVHLSAGDQMVALETALHRRCGGSSPARLLADQPTLVRQLWDWLCRSTTSRTWGVVLRRRRSDMYTLDNTLVSFSACGILGGVAPGSTRVSDVWTTDDTSLCGTCVMGPCSPGGVGGGTAPAQRQVHVVEAHRELPGTGYWIQTVTGSEKISQLIGHTDCSHSIHAVNSKWLLVGDMRKTGLDIFSIWDRASRHIGNTSDGCSTLDSVEPFHLFFNGSDQDEGLVVTRGPVFVVIDVAQSFSGGGAKVLSETKWKKPTALGLIEKVLVFNSRKISRDPFSRVSRAFIVLTESSCFSFSSKLFIVEETTGNFKKLSKRAYLLSQLNETTFCVSLPTEYQLWVVSSGITAVHLRSFPLGSAKVATAECGFLFHSSKDGTAINVTDASTGNLIISLTNLPPKSMQRIFGFVV